MTTTFTVAQAGKLLELLQDHTSVELSVYNIEHWETNDQMVVVSFELGKYEYHIATDGLTRKTVDDFITTSPAIASA